ncbi:MAG: ABC transporter ATP-binding protein [Burkholderiaceae bacterium]|nr:ABC transporter ATP-binding protein [Burkholderiaceae bacterium]
MKLFQVRGLTKQYGGLRAVDGVDLDIARGEIVGLIGPNGAGKSTLVELLTGGVAATSGVIEFEGRDITRLDCHQRSALGIGRTFQVPQPFGGSTILDNVVTGALFGRGNRHMAPAAARKRAQEILDRLGLGSVSQQSPGSLTTAGLKRLEMARCLATDPQMVFLDEPLGGLNSSEVRDSLDMIRAIRAGGATIVFIEHIIPAVLSLCERVVVLANGRKLAEGTGSEVTSNPLVQKAYLGDVATAARRRHRAGKTVETEAARG